MAKTTNKESTKATAKKTGSGEELPQTSDQKQSSVWGLLALAFTGLFGLSKLGAKKNR
ncbi:LPXTG cell wall anchor domain-containing protein [Paucilactobacillus suebicus]|uniref:LPXTG cell wall anchor domain-containing protein n=1 Tax=Paucilactobacillus suebicus TaxID=152335 RepID=UPI0012DE64A3|nr:LPXTG cell wall anchor domain-containing protein [Paucilactobacillus suebicus]